MRMSSRRRFLKQSGGAAVVGGVLAAGGAAQAAHPEDHPTRRVVPGWLSKAYSRAVVYGDLAFIAGVVGVKPGTKEVPSDFKEEVRQTLDNLKASVEAAGSSLDRVLKCTVFLTEFELFAPFNEIYTTYFPKDPPARSTVVVKAIVVPGSHVEVDCVTTV